jgi:putative iron-dependent peroxidase
MVMSDSRDRVPIAAQTIEATLSQFATFLVLRIGESDEDLATARDTISGIDDLLKTVGFRDLSAHLSCVVGIGSDAWNRLSPDRRPAQLRRFPPIDAGKHVAPSTPGDLLLHVRAERSDLCFEFVRVAMDAFGDSVTVVDETTAFRYFDARDLLGFVDGTANPVGPELTQAALIGDEDPDFAGGSYVVVQKYLHDLKTWASYGADKQSEIIGRDKADNVELPDADSGQKAHKTLTTIEVGGVERAILRDNMPFGRAGEGEFGTYFIGYAGNVAVTLTMLRRMFLGDPLGLYDRILDVSTATTGTLFFAPSAEMLATLADPGS